jgi:Bcr/CflA subfamily drug resistance transporter
MVYTPSVADASKSFAISHELAFETIAVFTFGLGIGNLLWGTLSDRIGRKPSVIIGLLFFVFGSVSCYLSYNFYTFLLSRFIQALGCAMGPVLAQVILRDSTDENEIGKVFSKISSIIAIFPALCPLLGSIIVKYMGWHSIFIVLALSVSAFTSLVSIKLSETKPHSITSKRPLARIAIQMIIDKRLLACAFLVGACNAISLIYYSEGSFCMIEVLGVSRIMYGSTFIFLSLATVTGGIISGRLQNKDTAEKIIKHGIAICSVGSIILLVSSYTFVAEPVVMGVLFLVCNMIARVGTCMVYTNALAESVKDYKWCFGAASSIFGLINCCITALLAQLMIYIHDGTLKAVPFYLIILSLLMLIAPLRKGMGQSTTN